MGGAGCLLAVNELPWTVTHFGSSSVVDNLQGKKWNKHGSWCLLQVSAKPAGHLYLVVVRRGSKKLRMPLGHERWNAHILIKFRSFQDSSIWCNPDSLGSSKCSEVQKNFIARATLHQLSVTYLDVGVSQGKEAQQGSHTHTLTLIHTEGGAGNSPLF